ncbi:MAG TPA: hypothetical protein VIL35_03945 [Vicinamibacterales bacterium]
MSWSYMFEDPRYARMLRIAVAVIVGVLVSVTAYADAVGIEPIPAVKASASFEGGGVTVPIPSGQLTHRTACAR